MGKNEKKQLTFVEGFGIIIFALSDRASEKNKKLQKRTKSSEKCLTQKKKSDKI